MIGVFPSSSEYSFAFSRPWAIDLTRSGGVAWLALNRWLILGTANSFNSSSSVMQAYFANQSCDPFLAESRPCVIGNYVSYAINVSTTAHVVAAVNFVNTYNIRLVIRNTGHEYVSPNTQDA